jgi:uncharacterized protein involved in exopolysaccharide biosynthesis
MDDFQSVTTEPEALADSIDFEGIEAGQPYEEFSAKAARLVRLLWQRRKIVLRIVAAGIVCSLIYVLLLPNIFSSTATIMPPGNSSPYSNLLSAFAGPTAGSITSETLGLDTPGELYVAILQSRNVEDGLISRFNLMDYYHARLIADARNGLAGDTKVSSDVKSGVITVTVKARSAVLAANLANGYVDELNRVLTTNSTSSARRQREFLEERLKGIKKDLDDSSKALSQFSSKSKTIDVDTQAKSMVDQGLKLEGELIEGRSELASLRQVYSADNTRVKAAEARVAELEHQIELMGGVSGATNQKNGGNSLYPTATELPTLGLTYADLDRKVKVDEELWATLTKQYEAAKVEEVKEIPTARVLDTGVTPEKKSAPTRWLIMVIGTFLSFLVGCFAVIGLERWREIDEQDEPKRILTDIFNAVVTRHTHS